MGGRGDRGREDLEGEENYSPSCICMWFLCDVFDGFVRLVFRLCRLLHLYKLADRINDWSFVIYSKYCVPYVSEEEQREIDEILKGRDFEYGEPIPLEEFLKKLEEDKRLQ